MTLDLDINLGPGRGTEVDLARPGSAVAARGGHYPRSGGVAVPPELRDICRSLLGQPNLEDFGRRLPAVLSIERRQELRDAVVGVVARALRRPAPDLIDVELPPPRVALSTLPLEIRTRHVLDRQFPMAQERPWTVGQYLEIPQFGAHCLVDLLAAREEARRPTAPSRPPSGGRSRMPALELARLDEVSALICRRAPLAGSEIGELLLREGLAGRSVSLKQLLDAYGRAGGSPPFRVVRRGDVSWIFPRGTVGLVETVAATAMQLIVSWGLATVQAVTARVRALGPSALTRDIVSRAVVGLPRFRWLDRRAGWFSVRDQETRLSIAVRKVFAVVDRIRLDELRRALSKGRSRRGSAPARVIDAYLSEVADCEFEGHWVRPRQPTPVSDLSRIERTLVGIFNAFGRELEHETLRARAAARAISQRTLDRLLRASPLFLAVAGGRVRLIGAC